MALINQALVGSLREGSYIVGFVEVVTNLNKAIAEIKAKTPQGLAMALYFIRRDTEKTPYVTPLDYGNLKSSWFIASGVGISQPDEYNTGFVNNPERKITASQFRSWHDQAAAEAVGQIKANEAAGEICVVGGYSANYALWVHENMEAKYWSKAGSGPKWFEASLKRNSDKMLEIIRDNIKII